MKTMLLALMVAALAMAAGPRHAAAADAPAAAPDTLRFRPTPREREAPGAEDEAHFGHGDQWLRPGTDERLLTEPDQWRAEGRRYTRTDLLLDYNRVDPLRVGLKWEAQAPGTLYPRVGARLAYATVRERVLYGLQIEQPLVPTGRYAVGVSIDRATDHNPLEQVEDFENSLAFLFARTDNRDYFEREGYGAYLAWRVPDFSTISAHLRSDDERSIPLYENARSWFYRDRELRPNPAIDDGTAHTASLRFERLNRRRLLRAGIYHHLELERAGGPLGGDFDYTRLLGDVRAVLRVSPASTLVLRGVVGHTSSGALPFQRQMVAGGVDGLRAHEFDQYRGDQMLLGQAEVVLGLWRLRTRSFEAGLHAMGFIDSGRAWFDPGHLWNADRQRYAADAGFGLGTSEDNLRVYFAKNLQEPSSSFVISVRIQRPF